MMITKYEQKLKIDDTVDLTEIGYDEGSEATIIVNATLSVRREWDATYDEEMREEETEEAYMDRIHMMRINLVPYMVTNVRLIKDDQVIEQPINTPEDAAKIHYGIDDQIFRLAVSEIPKRSAARRLNAGYTFQGERTRHALRSRLQATTGATRDDSSESDSAD